MIDEDYIEIGQAKINPNTLSIRYVPHGVEAYVEVGIYIKPKELINNLNSYVYLAKWITDRLDYYTGLHKITIKQDSKRNLTIQEYSIARKDILIEYEPGFVPPGYEEVALYLQKITNHMGVLDIPFSRLR
jgi:hypothetical protein